MKQCKVCGNVGEDNSVYCPVCGNQFPEQIEKTTEETETTEKAADTAAEAAKMPEAAEAKAAEAKTPEAVQTAPEAGQKRPVRGTAPVNQPGRRPRRTKSGPQIYGQIDMDQNKAAPGGQQGTIRREIPGGAPAGRPVNTEQRRPEAQTANGQNRASGQPVNGQNRMPGQSVNGQNRMMGQPVNGQNRMPGQLVNGQNRMMGQPVNGQNRMPGQPVNGQNRMPGQPMNGQNRMMGQPMNGQNRMMAGRQPQGVPAGRIIETARAACKSPVFLLIALLHTVFLASSIAAIFMHELNYAQVARLIGSFQLPAQMNTYMAAIQALLSRLDSGAVVVNLAIHIPDLLFCIGLWLVFFTARTKEEKMSGIGFTLMKIVVLINMAVSSFVMLAVLIVCVAFVISAWVSGMRGMMIAAVLVLIAVIVITMAVVMYFFCYLATIKTCRLGAGTGEIYGSASAYVAVVHVVFSLFSIIGLLSGIVNMEITGITKSIGTLGWMILFGVWILSYRGKMSEFE